MKILKPTCTPQFLRQQIGLIFKIILNAAILQIFPDVSF